MRPTYIRVPFLLAGCACLVEREPDSAGRGRELDRRFGEILNGWLASTRAVRPGLLPAGLVSRFTSYEYCPANSPVASPAV